MRRLYWEAFVDFKGATGYRPLGWAGRQPDSISTADHNLNAKSELFEGNLGTLSLGASHTYSLLKPRPNWVYKYNIGY